ncbi:phosphatases II [Auricularia subglabra TFB-10046 SS5]|nr:phosphatases II [Auricularia subglabra TFB-10046 SS5]
MQAAPWQAGYVSQEEKDRAAELAYLASQHHTSDYNRLKFGPKGAPFAYVPISIQFPAHVEELRVQQAQSALRKAWWPSECVRVEQTTAVQLVGPSSPPPPPVPVQNRSPPSLHPPASATLQHELSLAMSSQLSLRSPLPPHAQALVPKTSETHPINISLMVPFELLPVLSAKLERAAANSPTLFNLPHAFRLDQLAGCAAPPPPPPVNLPPPTRMHLAQPAIVSVAPITARPEPDALPDNYPPIPYPPVKVAPQPLPSVPAPVSETTQTIAPVVILERDTQLRPTLLKFNAAELANAMDDLAGASTPSIATTLPRGPGAGSARAAPLTPAPASFVLGNLLLSSCPGKKVRLTGPVKGRGAICRDLRSDLSRVKDIGVGCIVCCLDDDELDFLGASWTEYSAVANSIGLDVLRLPTPEGLAPLVPRVVDEHLGRAIHQYTMRGVPILVHCRGGVGRAGLIACCWMLKLGLCGWERDSVALVERVIAVVRRRRSIKAIETFEQVRFLVDFVDYLRKTL